MSLLSHFSPEHSRVTVGIVTYNSEEHIAACLDSIATNLADAMPSVIVLDNASSDKTVQIVTDRKKHYPFPITVIPEIVNHGYAGGVNLICDLIKTEWICLINPDAHLLTAAFPPSKELARQVPTCGVIGGIHLSPDGKPQESGGVFPSPSMAVWDWCGLRHIFPRKNWSTTIKLDLPVDSPPRRIDYPTGAFWLFRREVYKRVGAFDEQFFLYFEETDFCKRARELGWPSYVMPSIRIEHIRGASVPEPDDEAAIDPLQIYFESMIRYLRKHFAKWRVRRALGIIDSWLVFRRWARKDEKSERLLKAFRTGLENANRISEVEQDR